MPSSHSSPTPNPKALKREAKRLRQALETGDVTAIRRARAVFKDLDGIPDADVAERMPLMRCQHVIAKEHGANNWSEQKQTWEHQVASSGWMDHMSSGHYRVITKPHHEAIVTLSAAMDKGSAPRASGRMMAELTSFSWEYSTIATRQECREFFAWAFRSLTKEDADIGIDGIITLHAGAFRLVPLSPGDFSRLREQIDDDDPGTDWMPKSDD